MKKYLLSLLIGFLILVFLWFRFPHHSHRFLRHFHRSGSLPGNAFVLTGQGVTLALSGDKGPAYGKPLYLAGKNGPTSLIVAEFPFLSSIHPALGIDHPVVYTRVRINDDGESATAEGDAEGLEAVRVVTRYSLGADGILIETTILSRYGKQIVVWVGDSALVRAESIVLPGCGRVFPHGGEVQTLSPIEPWAAVNGTDGSLVLSEDKGMEGMYSFVRKNRLSTGKEIVVGKDTMTLVRHLNIVEGTIPEPSIRYSDALPLLRMNDEASGPLTRGRTFSLSLETKEIAVPQNAPGALRPTLFVSPNLKIIDHAADGRWRMRAEEGGTGWAAACLGGGRHQICSNRVLFLFEGPGWYPGDLHSHTDYSYSWEGHSTAEMIEGAKRRGMRILAVTDYNSVTRSPECREGRDFICFSGAEVVSPVSGHGTAYFSGREPWLFLGSQEWIERITKGGGLFFIAHPFLEGRTWKNWATTGYTGMEVWNDHCGGVRSRENLMAFEKWDDLLNRGKRIYGIAVSDAHRPDRVGGVRSVFYLPEFSLPALRESLGHGRFYGTNGPDVRFSINGAVMGSVVRIKRGDAVRISVQASDPSPLLMVTLIERGMAVRRWRGEKEEESLRPARSTWFRVEAEYGAGRFAFSNPIWVDVL